MGWLSAILLQFCLTTPLCCQPSIATGLAAGQPSSANTSANSFVPESSIPSTLPAPPPPGPTGRPRIGLALSGGSALAISEIGVLQWFEEHHIPVDSIAGTSMGALIGALYATGKSPDQIKLELSSDVFNSVFRIDTAYKNRGLRRREDSRDLPSGVQVGLRHGVSLRNSVLTDQGLNAFLDREFYRYDDRSEFNLLPIPFRCISTDLNDARAVTFARGSIPDAVRASVSLPGYFRPFEINGHQFVDGGVLDNLPTQTIRDMRADVTLAVSIPLLPVTSDDLGSILGVLERSFSVAIEDNQRRSRALADVLMVPDLTGFSSNDYLKASEISARGYAAAEQNKAALLKYALNDAQWSAYLASRAARVRNAPGSVLSVRVDAPDPSSTRAVEQLSLPLVGQPMDPDAVDKLLADIRSDGRYDAAYSVTYEASETNGPPNRPALLINVKDKVTGPPFLLVGVNAEVQSGSAVRPTVEGIFLDQDFGGYGSELRAHLATGYLTRLDAEYFRKLPTPGAQRGELFIAPHAGILREPFYIYGSQTRVSQRMLQRAGAGIDFGWADRYTREFRVGWEMNNIRWSTDVGSASDSLPNVFGSMQQVRLRLVYDTQDRALIPQFGLHLTAQAGYLFRAVESPDAPQFAAQASIAHRIDKNIVVISVDAGTMLNRKVAQPFRFTLGGPLRLSASAIDEYRGTDYFVLSPVFLRRIASLPAPLGQNIYLGAGYEAGQMRAPDAVTITRQDVFFGIFAETPLGVITLSPAIGDGGYRKLTFTLGKFF